MARTGRDQAADERTSGRLWADLGWFVLHTFAAVAMLLVVLGGITWTRPDPDSVQLKLTATALAFVVPALAGLAMAWGGWGRAGARRAWSRPARFVWISGLLVFASAALWVWGLPTGPGLCEGCGGAEKLWRTFFVLQRGSGLMGGDGLVVGCWVPLATFGYALGAGLGLRL
ncbi:MAG: hypothetical protein M3O02_06090 [Acidobacteriota bacterium]|nr:hypothetical protein [Acidobacteriota bacterium]